MKTWRIAMFFYSSNQEIRTGIINIARGIFQGDSLSPLWFCLALNLL
jgi:hypothetical protein